MCFDIVTLTKNQWDNRICLSDMVLENSVCLLCFKLKRHTLGNQLRHRQITHGRSNYQAR